MAAKFTEAANYQYLCKLARDANGDEQKRRKELVEFRNKQQKEKTACKERCAQKSQETAARIAATGLIMDKEKVLALKGQALKDQLKVFKNAGAPNLVKGKLPTLVGEIRQTLSDAIDLYQQGECWSQTQRVLVMRQGLRMRVIGWMRTEFNFLNLNYIY